ncbi:hypothetical protein ABRP62_01600 [Corynebacterium sp. KPL2636]|uniref:hypothetical protein n=1 Tax=Corynebacterium sp. KPL2636 TaxID=3158309 RepID=UPI0032ED13F9
MTDPMLPPHDQHIIVSALRHCRERPSYFLHHTTRWVMENWEELDERTQEQLIRGARLDLRLRAQLTQEEKAQLARERPDWNSYLNFIQRKMND